MATFISLVGFQPAAIAVPLVSWIKAHPGESISAVLLATKQVKDTAERLKQWMQSQHHMYCDCIPIELNQLSAETRLPLAETVERLLERFPEEQILFNAGPGLNSHVAIFARSLPEGTIFLHPMLDSIHTCLFRDGREQWGVVGLSDVGLEGLLELYGISYRVTGKSPPVIQGLIREALPDWIREGLKFEGIPETFDLAFEKAGFLYGLKLVEGKNTLRQTRDLQRLQNDLPGLQPRIAVLSPLPAVLARARSAGFLPIHSNTRQGENRLRRWIAREVLRPGAEGYTSEKPLSQKPLAQITQGKGGGGSTLAVCLGNDPSATLISLCTHQPKSVWILYDSATQTVVEVAHRVKQSVKKLPVGQVRFVKTDHVGKGVLEAWFAASDKPMRADITPGTKAQGVALARLPEVDLWSLQGDAGEARGISDPQQCLKLASPDVLTQAYCCGGELADKGRLHEVPQKSRRFWDLLAKFCHACLQEHPSEALALRNLSCDSGSLQVNANCVTIQFQQQVAHEVVGAKDQQGGFWFEVLTANAFRLAGADEVHCGIKWDWPEGLRYQYVGRQYRRTFMTEVDVLARFGHRFLAISCKAGKTAGIAQPQREIEAVARVGMGRFCIPIFVRPRFPEPIIERQLRSKKGAILLDLRYLSDPKLLYDTLEGSFRFRSTLQGE